MSDDLKKVITGEKFRPSAKAWNAFIDAALAHRQRMFDAGQGTGGGKGSTGIVPLRNDSGTDLDQYSVIILDTLLVTPTDNLDDFLQRQPVFSGNAVTADNLTKPFAILQEPLKDTLIGAAMITGVTPARIEISDASHAFANLAATGLQSAASGIVRILWKESGTGTKWAMIHFPTGGGAGTQIKWARVSSTTGNTNSYLCDIFETRENVSADESAKSVKVWDIVDTLKVNDWIPVQSSSVDGFDYECIQQIGLL